MNYLQIVSYSLPSLLGFVDGLHLSASILISYVARSVPIAHVITHMIGGDISKKLMMMTSTNDILKTSNARATQPL